MRSSPGPRLVKPSPERPILCGWRGCTHAVLHGYIRCADHVLVIEGRPAARPVRSPVYNPKRVATCRMRPQVRAIAEAVAAEFGGVALEEIVSEWRLRTVSRARQAAMFVVRMNTKMSFKEIAREFRKDNKAPFFAVRAVTKRLEQGDPETRRAVDAGTFAAVNWSEVGKAAE
jgi:hypothetical protein